MDPNNTAAAGIFAETDAEANEFRRRGFHEFKEMRVFRRGAAHSSFPWPMEETAAAPPAAAAAAAAPQEEDEMPLPDELTVPLEERPPPESLFTPHQHVPVLRRNGGGTELEKWIECFEVKVVCERLNDVYSPIRLWDKKEYAKISTLNSRLLQYYFAKQNLSTSNGKETLDNVKKVARKHAKETYGDNERYLSGDNLKYFDICLALYNSSVSS